MEQNVRIGRLAAHSSDIVGQQMHTVEEVARSHLEDAIR